MATKIFTEKTDEKVISLFGSLKLVTIIGGEEGDDEGGRSFDEELPLVFGNPQRIAFTAVFLWARLNGLPLDRAALDGLIRELRKQRLVFAQKKKRFLAARGRQAGRRQPFAARVAELVSTKTRAEICDITWSEFYQRPKPRENSTLWKEHANRVRNTAYNLTARPPRRGSRR